MSQEITEELVLTTLSTSPKGLTLVGVREGLGLPTSVQTSNRLAYLLTTLRKKGKVDSEGSGRTRLWANNLGKCSIFGSVLLFLADEKGELLIAQAVPRSSEAQTRLLSLRCEPEFAELASDAIHIKLGFMGPISENEEPSLLGMLDLLEDIDLTHVTGDVIDLTDGFSTAIVLRY
jgi:hypothetical protein